MISGLRCLHVAVVLGGLSGGLCLGQAVPAVNTSEPAGYTTAVALWPEGAPLAKGAGAEDVPKLYEYPASGAGAHAAVIVMPGGGYNHLVMEKEGAVEARWLNAHGVSAFVLAYRLSPKYMYPAAMLDGERAVRYVRAHAQEMGIDPTKIGVWGFSAGGHLAGYLAAIHDAGKPNASDPVGTGEQPAGLCDSELCAVDHER